MSSYSSDWKEIAYHIKSKANWRCQKCGRQCLRPKKDNLSLSRSQKAALTLQVHHWNRQPWDNREENLVALCSACHLSYHYLGHAWAIRVRNLPLITGYSQSSETKIRDSLRFSAKNCTVVCQAFSAASGT